MRQKCQKEQGDLGIERIGKEALCEYSTQGGALSRARFLAVPVVAAPHGQADPDQISGAGQLDHGKSSCRGGEQGGQPQRSGKDMDETTGTHAQRGNGTAAPAKTGTATHDIRYILTRRDVQQQAGYDEQRDIVNPEHRVPLAFHNGRRFRHREDAVVGPVENIGIDQEKQHESQVGDKRLPQSHIQPPGNHRHGEQEKGCFEQHGVDYPEHGGSVTQGAPHADQGMVEGKVEYIVADHGRQRDGQGHAAYLEQFFVQQPRGKRRAGQQADYFEHHGVSKSI